MERIGKTNFTFTRPEGCGAEASIEDVNYGNQALDIEPTVTIRLDCRKRCPLILKNQYLETSANTTNKALEESVPQIESFLAQCTQRSVNVDDS